MSSTAFKFTWNKAKLNDIRRGVQEGLIRMGLDIANKARHNAPYDGGTLTNSIRVDTPEKNVVYVKAGGKADGKTVAYARRREFENKKNPQTKHYLTNAFNDVAKNFKEYFKGIVK